MSTAAAAHADSQPVEQMVRQHDRVAPGTRRHSHLWRLPDGTGLHAPLGELAVDAASGRLCCHLCGRWYRSLGSHVRTHGYTAVTYRATMGLCLRTALTAQDVSASISARKARSYAEDADHRAAFEVGHAMARDGRLTTAGAIARRASADEPEPVERRKVRERALSTGRDTMRQRRQASLDALLSQQGEPDLSSYLRRAYNEGASLETLAQRTGLGRTRLRTALAAAQVEVRASGLNTDTGKRSRAVTAEAAAAARLGTEDLHHWLRTRHGEGWTLGALARAVGHSTHWVRWRLASDPLPSSHTPGRAEPAPAASPETAPADLSLSAQQSSETGQCGERTARAR